MEKIQIKKCHIDVKPRKNGVILLNVVLKPNAVADEHVMKEALKFIGGMSFDKITAVFLENTISTPIAMALACRLMLFVDVVGVFDNKFSSYVIVGSKTLAYQEGDFVSLD